MRLSYLTVSYAELYGVKVQGYSRLRKSGWAGRLKGFRCMSSLTGSTFFLDEFAFRQFEGGRAAQIDCSKSDFIRKVHELFDQVLGVFPLAQNLVLDFLPLRYAGFCRQQKQFRRFLVSLNRVKQPQTALRVIN